MLHQGLILTAHREYAQTIRSGLLALGNDRTRVDIELDALRAMQLMPQQYDLLLLDMVLDSMDGLQLLQLMKQQAPASKFVIVSDTPDEASRALSYQNGADFFLKRPRTPPAFKKAVEEIGLLLKKGTVEKSAENGDEGVMARIIDLVQTRCLSGDSVLLMVHGRHQSGDIFIYRGEVYHAQFPGKSGDGAFYEMCLWDDGQVRIKTLKLNHSPARTIELPYQKLLDRAQKLEPLSQGLKPSTGQLLAVSNQPAPDAVPDVMLEAPPLQEDVAAQPAPGSELAPPIPIGGGETPLPQVNAHWKVNLMGELVEGSQLADAQRAAFITYFFYRKLADVAVALEVDYFNHMTLLGAHLQQVLVADNMGIRHAVFDTKWTTELEREQYVRWCCEQSF